MGADARLYHKLDWITPIEAPPADASVAKNRRAREALSRIQRLARPPLPRACARALVVWSAPSRCRCGSHRQVSRSSNVPSHRDAGQTGRVKRGAGGAGRVVTPGSNRDPGGGCRLVGSRMPG